MGAEQRRSRRVEALERGLPEDLEAWLEATEAGIPDLRDGAAKTVVWADGGTRARTAFAVVYLHGFSADRHEIDPLPRRVAEEICANLYYARLAGHGRSGASLADADMEDWLLDAAEAMAIGARLGERVIVLGTSTGGTLALWIAGQRRWRDVLAALVLVSPNLALRSRAARLLSGRLGRLLARLAVGRDYRFEAQNEAQALHWTTRYPSSALVAMMRLVRAVRALPLEQVNVPAFMAYSPLDRVVDPSAALAAMRRLRSPVKRTFAVEGDGDAQHHVVAGDILSPGTTAALTREILEFLEEIR